MIDPKDREKLYLCNRGCVWRVRETDSRGVTMKLFATPDLSRTIKIVKRIFSNLEFVTDEVDLSLRKFLLNGKKDLASMSSIEGVEDWAIIKEITQ